MPAKKETGSEKLMYKGKPLVRRLNSIYYGNPEDEYIIYMQVNEATKIIDLDIATNVTIQLQTSAPLGEERVIKKAERDGLYAALDLGEFWLAEALGEDAE